MTTKEGRLLILLSGKRKSGKDFFAQLLAAKLRSCGWEVSVVGISYSLKEEFSREHGLDYGKLLEEGEYKEKFRAQMVMWGERRRKQQPDYFTRKALLAADSEAEVVMVSDCRRESDIRSLQGIDDSETECGLDNWKDWDVVVRNEGGDLAEASQLIITRLRLLLHPKQL